MTFRFATSGSPDVLRVWADWGSLTTQFHDNCRAFGKQFGAERYAYREVYGKLIFLGLHLDKRPPKWRETRRGLVLPWRNNPLYQELERLDQTLPPLPGIPQRLTSNHRFLQPVFRQGWDKQVYLELPEAPDEALGPQWAECLYSQLQRQTKSGIQLR